MWQEPSITANTPRLHAAEVKCRDAPFAKDKVHTVVRAHPNSTSMPHPCLRAYASTSAHTCARARVHRPSGTGCAALPLEPRG